MPFVKGMSGNPNGRPKKGLSFTDIIRHQADFINKRTGEKNKDAIVKKLWELADDGDMTALKYLMDRVDGTPRQSMDLGVVDGPLGIAISFGDEDEGDTTSEV